MNIPRIIVALALLFTLTAFGSFFEKLLPTAAADSSPLAISARIGNTPLDTTTSNKAVLPATIVFTANKPATIYYTTNGTDPTISTTTFSTIATADASATGPTITSPDSIVVTLGEDTAGNLSSVQSYTFFTP